MVPKGWKKETLGGLGKWTGGGTPSMANQSYWQNGNIPWVSSKDMKLGELITTEDKITQLAVQKSSTQLVPKDSILLVIRSGILRRHVPIAITKCQMAINQDIKALIAKKDICHPRYVWNYLLCYSNLILKNCGKVGTTVESLDFDAFKSFFIPLPPLDEQIKIAKILSTWDKAIETTEQLLNNSLQQKKALKQKLLTGKKRFLKFKSQSGFFKTPYGLIPLDWGFVYIAEVAKQVIKKNINSKELPVLSCSKYIGFIDSLKYFKKQVFSKDTSNYNIVERGCFAFPSNHIEEGSIGYQDVYEAGIVSPIYTVFKTNDKIDDNYLYNLLKTEHYRQIFAASTNASVDRRGSLRWKEFSKIKVPLPTICEQQKIASTLSTADQEIIRLQQHLAYLKQEKKSLMQQLLTGKQRVKI